ncbi:MAG: hypothetical protein EU533_06900 [Promethearchaeota archaeon]|nr:MAG: hypothetical protein EU533_06900 [Candidatus Lokiarchaeota archaeon]
MSSEEEKDALRKLIMLISDLRAKDEERYEAHVNFMNETIKMISAIESQMNKHWSTVLNSLKELNENINNNLDSLLTGINPKGLRETSKSLQEIMDTMTKSVQSMSLEKVLSELKDLKSGTFMTEAGMSPQTISVGQQPEQITAGINLNPPSPNLNPPPQEEEKEEVYGFVPGKKKKKSEEDEPHLMKPSDLFKQ